MLAMMCRRHHVPFIARGVVNGVLHDRAVAAACVDVDAGSPRSPGQLLYQRRTLFSDEYLRIDEFNQRRNKVRLTINDESQFKERVKHLACSDVWHNVQSIEFLLTLSLHPSCEKPSRHQA